MTVARAITTARAYAASGDDFAALDVLNAALDRFTGSRAWSRLYLAKCEILDRRIDAMVAASQGQR